MDVLSFKSVDADPYKWPHDSSMSPKTTALVIIDMQVDCRSCSSLNPSDCLIFVKGVSTSITSFMVFNPHHVC